MLLDGRIFRLDNVGWLGQKGWILRMSVIGEPNEILLLVYPQDKFLWHLKQRNVCIVFRRREGQIEATVISCIRGRIGVYPFFQECMRELNECLRDWLVFVFLPTIYFLTCVPCYRKRKGYRQCIEYVGLSCTYFLCRPYFMFHSVILCGLS